MANAEFGLVISRDALNQAITLHNQGYVQASYLALAEAGDNYAAAAAKIVEDGGIDVELEIEIGIALVRRRDGWSFVSALCYPSQSLLDGHAVCECF